MLIRVRYADGRYDMVKPFFLDWLIASDRIVGFQRGGDWVVIGCAPLRRAGGNLFGGHDRRFSEPPPLLACLALGLRAQEGKNHRPAEHQE